MEKPIRLSTHEQLMLKRNGFINLDIARRVFRSLIKNMIPLGTRLSIKNTGHSLYIGFSVPLDYIPDDFVDQVEELSDKMESLKETIRLSKTQ